MAHSLFFSTKQNVRGAFLFGLGLLLCLVGELAGLLLPAVGLGSLAGTPVMGNPLYRQVVIAGLLLASSGLIVWGAHGIRTRGPKLSFIVMIVLGGWFSLGNLYYLCESYRTLFLSDQYRFVTGMAYYQSLLIIKIAVSLTILALTCLAAFFLRVPGKTHSASTLHGSKRQSRGVFARKLATARPRRRRSS